MTEFARLTAQFELSGFPEGLDALYDQYAVDYQPHALMRRGPVSYTHLDVYKRQLPPRHRCS